MEQGNSSKQRRPSPEPTWGQTPPDSSRARLFLHSRAQFRSLNRDPSGALADALTPGGGSKPSAAARAWGGPRDLGAALRVHAKALTEFRRRTSACQAPLAGARAGALRRRAGHRLRGRADLAAEGPTNREIAQSLYITTRTVEVHLSSVYRKLGISSRSQLRVALPRPAAPRAD
jgi:DNA-binding CsgD family transcriptional regulator